jgi:hypothetical protein
MPREINIPASVGQEDFVEVLETTGKWVRVVVANLQSDGKFDTRSAQVYLIDGEHYTTLTANPNWANSDLWPYIDQLRKT